LIGIVYSLKDPAGVGIASYIINKLGYTRSLICSHAVNCYSGPNFILAGFEEDDIYFDFLDEALPREVEYYLVLSRHYSEAGIKSYTVHPTGNFTNVAPVGGKPRELGLAHPQAMWYLLRRLHKYAREVYNRGEYEVSYEATHHGPTGLNKPIVFIEIGSSVVEWRDPINHEVVGMAILDLLSSHPNIPPCTPVIGFGGGHYPRKHTELALSESICYGHIASKHVLDYLDEEIIHQMINKTAGNVEEVIVEKKGVRRELRDLLEKFANARGLRTRYI
jgi:D-aminoacyl-tRNA deacylase